MQPISKEFLFLIELFSFLVGFISFGVWYIFDTYRLSQFDGKMKRGIKVWSRQLPYDAWQYLSSLKMDIVKEERSLFSVYKSEFIRIQGDEILIYSPLKRFRSTWSCIGYVDKTSPLHQMEYRMSLPGLIFLLPFTIFGILIFAFSFFSYKKAIDSFVERKTEEQVD